MKVHIIVLTMIIGPHSPLNERMTKDIYISIKNVLAFEKCSCGCDGSTIFMSGGFQRDVIQSGANLIFLMEAEND